MSWLNPVGLHIPICEPHGCWCGAEDSGQDLCCLVQREAPVGLAMDPPMAGLAVASPAPVWLPVRSLGQAGTAAGPLLSSVSLCRNKTSLHAATGQNFHSVAIGQYFRAAAHSQFGLCCCWAFFFLFPMFPISLCYQGWQSWVWYPGCCHLVCVQRKWPLPAAKDLASQSPGAARELMPIWAALTHFGGHSLG